MKKILIDISFRVSAFEPIKRDFNYSEHIRAASRRSHKPQVAFLSNKCALIKKKVNSDD